MEQIPFRTAFLKVLLASFFMEAVVTAATMLGNSALKVIEARQTGPLAINPNYSKPYKLSVLGILDGFYNVSDPVLNDCVLTTLPIVLDGFNSQSELLPDYNVEIVYHNGPHVSEPSDLTPLWQAFFDFIDNSERKLIMPLLFGPVYHCQDTIVQTIFSRIHSSVVTSMDFTWIVEYGCNGDDVLPLPFYSVNPRVESNVVRSNNNYMEIMALLAFIKFHRWRELAIVAIRKTSLSNDLHPIAQTVDELIRNDIKLVQLEYSATYDDAFIAIKRVGRARIILLPQDQVDCEECATLFCAAYKHGISAPKYVLLFASFNCFPCYYAGSSVKQTNITSGCKIEIQRKQLKIAIFSAATNIKLNTEKIPNVKWPVLLKIRIFADLSMAPAMKAIENKRCDFPKLDLIISSLINTIGDIFFLFNGAETILRSRNSTIRDVINMGNPNRTLGKAMLAAARYINMDGSGQVLEIDKRGPVYAMYIFQAVPENASSPNSGHVKRDFSKITVILKNSSFQAINTTDFEYLTLKPVIWATSNGLQPKDLSEVLHFQGGYNEWAVTIVTAAASTIFFLQSLAGGIVWLNKAPMTSKRRQAELFFDYECNLISLGGCLVLDIAVILLLSGTKYFPDQICHFRPLFIASGLAMINGTLFAKALALYSFCHENRYITQKARKPNIFNLEYHERTRVKALLKLNKTIFKQVSSLLLISSALVAIWIASDPIKLETRFEYQDDPIYDPEIDAYYDVELEYCSSPAQIYWIGFFTSCHFLLLAISCYHVNAHKAKMKFIRKQFLPEIRRLQSAIYNCTTIVLFVVLLMIVIPAKPAEIFYLKETIFSVCVVFYSLSTSGIVFSPFWTSYSIFKRAGYLARNNLLSRLNKLFHK